VNDSWGLKITYSNVVLLLDPGVVLKRADTITTYADAYPILFIGTPDSNVAAAVENVVVTGGEFEGSDVRHASSGSSESDKRYAIELKNTNNVEINGVTFTKIDSAAINPQAPDNYDYGNSAYYNTTKNYGLKVRGCSFLATQHSTAGRALIHAIRALGVDRCIISDNRAEWCDCFVAQGGTYDDLVDIETDTYTGSGGFAVKRTGRYLSVTNNLIFNSSEHALYLDGMDVTATGNTIVVSDTTTCNTDQVKIRGRNVTAAANTVTSAHACFSVNEAAFNVTIANNTCTALVDNSTAAGVIDINSDGLLAYIAARPYLATNYPVANINVVGNTLFLPAAAQTNGTAIRLNTDTSAGALECHLRNVNIQSNSIYNANIGVDMETTQAIYAGVSIRGNQFHGKPYTQASFVGAAQNITASDAGADTFTCVAHGLAVNDAITLVNNVAMSITSTGTGTTIAAGGVYYVAAVPDVDTFQLAQLKGGTVVNVTNNSTATFKKLNALSSLCVFRQRSGNDVSASAEVTLAGNMITGFRYLCYTSAAAGTGRTLPYGMMGNHLQYNYQLFNNAFTGISAYNNFHWNTGTRFPGREWQGNTSWGNSLRSETGNGENYGAILMVGAADVRIYYDDNNNYKAL
jgi:hypothetical protein